MLRVERDAHGRAHVPAGCWHHGSLPLLYVGISPKRPPTNGRAPSGQSLRSRIRYHYHGNAAGSTLRLTLGCLLAETLGIELQVVGSGRLTFAAGETRLSEWMGHHALVCWEQTTAPWLLEERLIRELDLPLNLDQNRGNPFYPLLRSTRAAARAAARRR